MSDNEEIVAEFLVESHENLDQLDRDMLVLEADPTRVELLAGIFRTIHTIKGTCGFLEFHRLESLTHAAENLLSRLRDREIGVSPPVVSVLLSSFDAVRQILRNIELEHNEGPNDYAELRQQLKEHSSGGVATATTTSTAPAAGRAAPAPRSSEAVAIPAAATDATVRVSVDLLDRLMNLVGELVLSRNQILSQHVGRDEMAFHAAVQRLNLITSELQEGVMKTRMQPIGNLWNKLPRIVRDLAVACGKQARIELHGKETELDKTILEAIKDPLTHIVRNSVDHGIETPEIRTQRGKPAEGVLQLRAFHEGGQVNIEVKDDGGGIDTERVRRKALERGLIGADQPLSERELLGLIFSPGFSTAEAVTNVSGRGVGMDVVKTNIERIGGQIDLQSCVGEGTTITIKIPLTLAIIPALTVSCRGGRYAIPQVSLTELVRVERGGGARGIEWLQGAPVYRLRGRLLPLVFLDRLLELTPTVEEPDSYNIVVLQADGQLFGLVVEQINDTQEIVVKPLSPWLKAADVFAGATIMGDGRVALILDVAGIGERADAVTPGAVTGRVVEQDNANSRATEPTTLLLFSAGDARRLALPLSQVARLEEIACRRIEWAGPQPVVQYRQQIMPLVLLSGHFGPDGVDPLSRDTVHVVVYTDAGRTIGLVVDRILDVVEQRLSLQRMVGRCGVLGTTVVQGRVTELVDASALAQSTLETFFADPVLAVGA